jgi:hypothetical protein
MGYMTEICILNDRIGDIKANPTQFVEELLEAIQDGSTRSGKYYVGRFGTTVLRPHHADDLRVTVSRYNRFAVIGGGDTYSLSDTDATEKHKEISDLLRTLELEREFLEARMTTILTKQDGKTDEEARKIVLKNRRR